MQSVRILILTFLECNLASGYPMFAHHTPLSTSDIKTSCSKHDLSWLCVLAQDTPWEPKDKRRWRGTEPAVSEDVCWSQPQGAQLDVSDFQHTAPKIHRMALYEINAGRVGLWNLVLEQVYSSGLLQEAAQAHSQLIPADCPELPPGLWLIFTADKWHADTEQWRHQNSA